MPAARYSIPRRMDIREEVFGVMALVRRPAARSCCATPRYAPGDLELSAAARTVERRCVPARRSRSPAGRGYALPLERSGAPRACARSTSMASP